MNVRIDTKSRILDSAENLFGMNGFDAVSLRDITASADANIASVNYHFQSKDALIDAVIARRIAPVNRRRMELLDAAGPNPTVEQILECFLRPVFEIKVAPVGPLMGRMLSNPDLFVERVFQKHLTFISQTFLAALGQALPRLAPTELAWRLHFSVGVMTHTLLLGSIFPNHQRLVQYRR